MSCVVVSPSYELWVSWSAPSINVGWKLRNYFVMFHQKIFLFSQIPQILLVLLLVETKGLWKLLLGLHLDMSRDTTRAVFGGFRPGLTESGLYSNRSLLVAWNFSIRKKRNFTIYVANTKAQISCAVTAQLICVFALRICRKTSHFLMKRL